MEIKQIRQGDELQLQIGGDLSIYDAKPLKEALLAALAQTQLLVVDLSGIGEIDSSGLQLLLLLRREAQQQGIALSLLRPSESVCSLLQLYGLYEDFTIAA